MLSLIAKIIVILALVTGFMLNYQVHTTFAKKIIGQQTDETLVDGVHNLIRCLGNQILPPTVCKGTNHDDKIDAGGVGFQTIYGLGGDDLIQGDIQSDTIFGGDGNDAIQGGNGSSTLFGNNGNDVLVGGGGPNILYGGGTSFLFGGNGDDQLIGGLDHEVMSGGPGHDLFICKGKPDLIVDFKPSEDKKEGNCVLF